MELAFGLGGWVVGGLVAALWLTGGAVSTSGYVRSRSRAKSATRHGLETAARTAVLGNLLALALTIVFGLIPAYLLWKMGMEHEWQALLYMLSAGAAFTMLPFIVIYYVAGVWLIWRASAFPAQDSGFLRLAIWSWLSLPGTALSWFVVLVLNLLAFGSQM
jgi:hypothetical protein